MDTSRIHATMVDGVENLVVSTKLDAYEVHALGLYLSYWPTDKTFEEILNLIGEDNEELAVWEPFEGHDSDFVTEQIENTLISLKEHFIAKDGG